MQVGILTADFLLHTALCVEREPSNGFTKQQSFQLLSAYGKQMGILS